MEASQDRARRVGAHARETGADAFRLFKTLASQPSWAVKLAVALAALVMLAAAAVLLIPAALVFLGVLLLSAAWQWARRLVSGAFPARDREGRRNVRVIVRESAEG